VQDNRQEGNNPGCPPLVLDVDPRELGKSGNPTSRKNFLMQPAANRIDDTVHRRAGMTPNAQIGPAYKIQGASPVCPSQENRGSGPRDNRKYNPGSVGANENH
jgi:hypothetical protein